MKDIYCKCSISLFSPCYFCGLRVKPIKLKDGEKMNKFGSVQWQSEMASRVYFKLQEGEKLTPAERAFIEVQNKRRVIK